MFRVLLCVPAFCSFAFALNPALDVSQYAHTSWKVRDGFAKGQIGPIAQTPDGYLWLGTDLGLFRFDGVTAVTWQPPPGQTLPSGHITSLLTARDGTLWIGTRNGLVSWRGGKITQHPAFDGYSVAALFEDREGVMWVSRGLLSGKWSSCTIQNGDVRCSGGPDEPLSAFYEDRRGNLWVGSLKGFWRWKPGPPKFYPVPAQRNGIHTLSEDDTGTLLIGTYAGIKRLVDDRLEPYRLGTLGDLRVQKMYRDREGSLWVGTTGQTLIHLHQGTIDVFGRSDGLSADTVHHFFEDREGNLWASTSEGLDRFRDFAVTTYSAKQGLSNALLVSVLADRNSGLWLGTYEGLKRWDRGEVISYGRGAPAGPTVSARVKEILGSGLPDGGVQTLFQDARGGLWVGMFPGVGYLEHDRFTFVKGAPGGNVYSIAEDTRGNLWIASQEHGLFRLSPSGDLQEIPPNILGPKDVISVLLADHSRGGLWIGFLGARLVYFMDGAVRASYTVVDGIGGGRVGNLRLDPDGTVWAATEGGLSRVKNGQVATLTSKNGLPCDSVQWAMEDDDRSFWLNTACGLVRISRSELDAWDKAADQEKNSNRRIQSTVFDASDGIRSVGNVGGYSPHVVRTADGKLWFATLDGVSLIDPRHLPTNKLPPPVHVEQIIADRKTYDINGELRLPPLARDLQIDYTALSLVAPEKVRFRYKLEGHDKDWQDVGPRRQAFYSDLAPRSYRFRVSACNNSGVWNESGTFLDFSVAPAYYQTSWFLVSAVAAFVGLIGTLYQLRLRQVAKRFEMRLEERVGERTRIARDFHDTLLQSFQGVLMKFHAVTYLLPDRPAEARRDLDRVIEQARQALTEGRDAVQGLRSSTVITNDLAFALTALGEELAVQLVGQVAPMFRVEVEGGSRHLAPLIRDDVYRIASEAVRNAFQHAHASQIEVEIRYDERYLRLRVRDDGRGIDPATLSVGGRDGHYGLVGMQERASLIGGKVVVQSKGDSGTAVELTVPASIAYAKSSQASA